MNFRQWLESIYPFTAKIKNHDGKPVTIYINPTKEELEKLTNILGFPNEVRVLLDDKHCYAWHDAYHVTIMNQLSVINPIPALIFNDGKEIIVEVTDASRHTTWHENPKVAEKIRQHPYIKQWKKIVVGYYNEDIVGDWEKLKSDPMRKAM